MKEYFLENDNAEVTLATLWAAHKTVLRGKLIQLSPKIKKEHRADLLKCTEEYQTLAKPLKRNPTWHSLIQLEPTLIYPSQRRLRNTSDGPGPSFTPKRTK